MMTSISITSTIASTALTSSVSVASESSDATSNDSTTKVVHTYLVAPSAHIGEVLAKYQEQFQSTITTTLHRTHLGTAASPTSTDNAVAVAKNQVVDHAAEPQVTVAPTTTNALSILESAVPSDVVASIRSLFSISSSTSASSSSQSILTTATQSTLSSVTRTSSNTQSTISSTSAPGALSGSSNSAPTASGAQHLPNNVIAGVATGATAGAVLIILALVYFLRRRQQRNSYSSAGSGGKGTYPEVAWLYDPKRTPPTASLHGGEDPSRAALLASAAATGSAAPLLASIAHDRHGDMEETDRNGASPRLRPIDPTSPLLAPPIPYGRESDESAAEDHDWRDERRMSPDLAVPAPAVSPRPARDSWAQNKDAWLSSPLLAASSEARSRESSPSRPISGERPHVSPPLSSPGFAYSNDTAFTPGFAADEPRRPLTAIFEETRGQ